MLKNLIGERRQLIIAILAVIAIAIHLLLWQLTEASPHVVNLPLYIALVLGGIPLVLELLLKVLRREFGSDLLAGISIVTSIILGEYLAGTLVVLMLSGGEALEAYAVRSASSVLAGAGQTHAVRRPSQDRFAARRRDRWIRSTLATSCWCFRTKSVRSTAR